MIDMLQDAALVWIFSYIFVVFFMGNDAPNGRLAIAKMMIFAPFLAATAVGALAIFSLDAVVKHFQSK